MRTLLALVLLAAFAAPSFADRTQVYSVRGADCGDCGREIVTALKKNKGVRKASFDLYKVEVTATLADGVTDRQVVALIEKVESGFEAFVGPGKGAYLPPAKYPDGVDVATLTSNGASVGPLEKLRVPGKFTVFDVYADWCGPCRALDAKFRDAVSGRKDIAVRKLNVVKFDTPLGRELGARLKALPHVIVFSPDGRRSEFTGATWEKVAEALELKERK